MAREKVEIHTTLQLDKWARNLDLNLPHTNEQQEYITQVVINFLAIKLIHFYTHNETLSLRDEIITKLKEHNIVPFPDDPDGQDPERLYFWLLGHPEAMRLANKSLGSIFPLRPQGNLLGSYGICHIDINHLLPKVGSVFQLEDVEHILHSGRLVEKFANHIPAAMIGLVGSGKSTLARRLNNEGVAITMPENAAKNIAGQPDMLEIAVTKKAKSVSRVLKIPWTGDMTVTIDSAALAPIQDETDGHESTDLERLIAYIILNITREFDYMWETVHSQAQTGAPLLPIATHQFLCFIFASAGLNEVPKDVLKLLDLLPWAPDKLIEIRPDPSIREQWLADSADLKRRQQALATEDNLKGCFRSLQRHYGENYVVIDPISTTVVSDIADIVSPNTSEVENMWHEIQIIAEGTRSIAYAGTPLKLKPALVTDQELRAKSLRQPEEFRETAIETLKVLKLIIDFSTKNEVFLSMFLYKFVTEYMQQAWVLEVGLRVLNIHMHQQYLPTRQIDPTKPMYNILISGLYSLGNAKHLIESFADKDLAMFVDVGSTVPLPTNREFLYLMEALTTPLKRAEYMLMAQEMDKEE